MAPSLEVFPVELEQDLKPKLNHARSFANLKYLSER